MGIHIKYRGLEDGPLLVTSTGVHAPTDGAGEKNVLKLTDAAGLALAGEHSHHKLALRQLEQERVLGEVRDRVQYLADAIDQMHVPESDDLGRAKAALTDQMDSLSLTADAEANTKAVHSIKVNWTATGQRILSSLENPIADVELADGEHTFTLNVDGEEHELKVQVNNSASKVDTQEEFLDRLARVITQVDPDIQAQVVHGERDAYDPASGTTGRERTVRLEISGPQDEAGPDFYLTQETDSGLLTNYKLNQVRSRRTASLEVEGQSLTQEDNLLSLDDGHITGTILDSTVGSAQVTAAGAAGVIQQELEGVIEQYNSLVSYLDAHADLLRPSLKDRIIRPLEDRLKDMSQVGLKGSIQGSITVQNSFTNKVKFDFGSVRETVLGEKGWTTALRDKLGQILDLEEDAFALELEGEDPLSQLRRASTLLDMVQMSIISGYY